MVHADLTRLDDDEGPAYRVMPNNEEAEQALLGAILVNNEVLNRVADFLRAEHFYLPVHARIFGAIEQLVERGQIANPITLKTFFEQRRGACRRSAAPTISRGSPARRRPSSMPAPMRRQIHDLYVRRQLIYDRRGRGQRSLRPTDRRDRDSQIERAEKSLFDLAESGSYDRDFRSFKDISVDAIAIMEAAYRQEAGMTGVSTGLRDLDDLLGGLHRSDLVILAARPGMGKTSLATNIAFHAAKQYRAEVQDDGTARVVDGAVVGFFSLEMSSEQLVTRVLAEESAHSVGPAAPRPDQQSRLRRHRAGKPGAVAHPVLYRRHAGAHHPGLEDAGQPP